MPPKIIFPSLSSSSSIIHNLNLKVISDLYRPCIKDVSIHDVSLPRGVALLAKRDFDKLLLEAVDEGLSSLGEPSKQAIYFHLERGFNVKKQEIPYKIEAFAKAIEKIFGLGANFLESLIMKRLYEKIGGVFEWQESTEFVFTKYVAAAKQNFLEKKRVKTIEELVECEEIRIEA
jgi:hypothetical protein